MPIVNSGKDWDSSPGAFWAKALSRAVWAKALCGAIWVKAFMVTAVVGDGVRGLLGVSGTYWVGISHGIFIKGQGLGDLSPPTSNLDAHICRGSLVQGYGGHRCGRELKQVSEDSVTWWVVVRHRIFLPGHGHGELSPPTVFPVFPSI